MSRTHSFRKYILWWSELLIFKPTILCLLEYFSTYKTGAVFLRHYLCFIVAFIYNEQLQNEQRLFLPCVQFSPCSIIELIQYFLDMMQESMWQSLSPKCILMLCSSCAKISLSYKRRDKVFLLSCPLQNSETSFTLNLNCLKENRKFQGVNFYQCQSFLEKIQECLLWFSFFLAMICLGYTSTSIWKQFDAHHLMTL